MSRDNHKRILVRGVNWIGDAVMTMPALRALRKANPGAHISLLVKPWVAPLFERDPNIDEIILYTDKHRQVSGKIRLAAQLRKETFDCAVLLQNAFDAAIIAFLAGIPERIGYARDGRSILLTKAIPFDQWAKSLHHIDYYLNLFGEAGAGDGRNMPWLYLAVDERISARQRLKSLRRPLIALNPGATYGSSKRWPASRFAEVAGRVLTELEGGIVLFGGPSEKSIADEIAKLIDRPGDLLNLAGTTSLRELAALISECDILVTNDSGPMHIGYAVGTPLVSVFGSTSPEHTGPCGPESLVLRKKTECSPCFERECKKDSLECMDLISSEDVFWALLRFVKKNRAVFFDRDGTLCRDAHYLNRMDDFEVFPEISSLEKLRKAGYLLVGVSNQSGIARGLVDEDFVRRINNIFMESYSFDGFYYCPHHPDEKCSCRKPEPGMLHRARKDFGIDLKRSVVVGDKDLDMLLAKAVGAKGILVNTGGAGTSVHAEYVAENLKEVADIILSMRDF